MLESTEEEGEPSKRLDYQNLSVHIFETKLLSV